jgi:hypothetical protein
MTDSFEKVRMLRYASSFVIAAYATVRLIPQDLRALLAAFLRSHPICSTFYEFVMTALCSGKRSFERVALILYRVT